MEPGKRFLPLEEAAQIARCCILDPRGWLGSTSFSEMSNPVVLLVTPRMVPDERERRGFLGSNRVRTIGWFG
jgi:hypothetical protein